MDIREVLLVMGPRVRARSTHLSHHGPLCPLSLCRQPLEEHFFALYPLVENRSARRVGIRSPTTHRVCFWVGVR